MDILTQTILDFIERNQAWAPVIMGLAAFGESLFIVGLFLPAAAMFLAVGALAAAGTLDIGPIIVLTVLGASIGDIVSYAIGWKSGRRIVYSAWAKPHRSRAVKARAFFKRYGAASVFICRFVGPLRCTVPFVAGMMRMNMLRFQLANIASAVIWVPMMLLPAWVTVKTVAPF